MSGSGRATEPEINAEYFAATAAKPPHPILQTLEPWLPEPGHAVDLGCGVGNGSVWLAQHGFSVHAIDIDGEAVAHTKSALAGFANTRVEQVDMARLDLEPCDVIIALFSLFFVRQDEIVPLLGRILSALRPGGVFAGQVLGARDEWAKPPYSCLSSQELAMALSGLEILHWDEVERDGKTVTGKSKHWHVFHVIGRKPAV
jgi:tellurite methyltransferase